MPGYAYPVGATEAETGTAKSVTEQITSANSLVTIFTATQKTKVNSVLASNAEGTILPVELHVYRATDTTNYFISKTRVLKSKFMTLPLISGDSRVNEVDVDETANKIGTEIVLQIGDAIKAKCPIEDVINITLDLKEGIK